jgi:uncharacterized protein (DUF1697 family)
VALTPRIALLRAVNVGGRKATSADLRLMMDALRLAEGRTLLQSGNLAFRSALTGPELEAELEAAFAARFGFFTDIMVRDAEEWRATIAANPLMEMAERDPAHMLVVALKSAADPVAVVALQAAIQGREQVAAAGRALFIAYPDGILASKLTGALIERRIGVRGTGRNWNTTLKLAALLEA